ncbi:MAG: DNA-directed RNA polymerase subunit A'' [Candidatus Nanohaloarchaea archaeon]
MVELPEKYKGREDEDELRERYREMRFEPGEAIGVIGAQSISEPATQMTMETYHSAGAAKVSITLGLPRLIEIVNARKNPKTPIMDVYLEEGKRNEEDAREIAAEIQEVKFRDVVSEDRFNIGQLEMEFVIDEDVLDEFRIDRDEIVEKLKEKTKKAVVEYEDNKITAYPDEEDYDLTDLQDLKKKAMDVRLKGMKGIEQVVILEEDGEWRIQTAGVNLRKVLNLDGVDATRTTTNDFFETKKVLGVEAARNMILRELQGTLEEQGMNVDVRWLLMISDTMTKRGKIEGATRYGLVGAKNSVLARAAFEETKNHITTAALEGEVDPLNSVVENIIVGQQIPVGTGLFDLKAEPGKAEPVEEPSIPMETEVEEEEEFDYEEIVSGTVDEVKEEVRENDLDVQEVIEAEREGKDRVTLVEWLQGRAGESGEEDEEDIDYEELVKGTVSHVKEIVEEGDVDVEKVIEAEEENKDRVTLVEWLEGRLEE